MLLSDAHPGAGRASARPLAKEIWAAMAPKERSYTGADHHSRTSCEKARKVPVHADSVTNAQPTPTPMLAITTASATSFAPAATLNPVKSAALLITQLDTVGFDARRAQSKIKGVEQSISAPLRAVSRQADRLAARVCMTLSADNMQEPVAVPEPPKPRGIAKRARVFQVPTENRRTNSI